MKLLFPLVSALALVSVVAGAAGAQPVVPPPLAPPVDAPIARRFDRPEHPWGPGHRGIDYGVAAGTPVRAAAAGRVTFSGTVGAVTAVTVQHAGGLETTYSDLADVHVTAGEDVGQGRWLGVAGTAHPAGDAGLHFGVKLNDEYVDPESYLGAVDVGDAIYLTPVQDPGVESVAHEADRCRTPEQVPREPVAPSDNVAVVIAALNTSTVDRVPALFDVPTRLGYPDDRTYFFSYRGHEGPGLHETYRATDTRGDLRVAARRLGAMLRAVARRHPDVGVDVIAHSQGGLVARELLTESAQAWDRGFPRVEHIVTFATPHRGAPLAGAAGHMRRATLTGGPLLDALGALAGDGWLPDPSSTAVWQMDPASPLMGRLAREDVVFGTRVLAVGIDGDLIVPADHAVYRGKTNRVVDHDGWPTSAHMAIVRSPEALRLAHAFLRDVGVGCATPAEMVAVAGARRVSSAERGLGPLFDVAEGAAVRGIPGVGLLAPVLHATL